MSRGKRITSGTIEKIMSMSNAGMNARQISEILDGISVRSIHAYIDCIRAAERNELELYSSKMVGEKAIQKYCDAHGLVAPVMTYFKKQEESNEEPEQIQIDDICEPEKQSSKEEMIYKAVGDMLRSLISIRDALCPYIQTKVD